MKWDKKRLFLILTTFKDPNWKNHPGRENKSTCVIVTMANWEWYQKWADNSVKRRGDDYDGIKNTVGEILIEQACQLFPQIRDHIDFKDVGKVFFLNRPFYRKNSFLFNCIDLIISTGH